MDRFNIYLAGVGGQGIGLLSEMILRAADHAGHFVKGVDTHGLAQRGGRVVSQIRIGNEIHSPLIRTHQADLVVALERHEALRAAADYATIGGTLVYYDTVWQPLDVRLGRTAEVSADAIQDWCRQCGVTIKAVYEPGLSDVRMQNTALLAHIARHKLIPDVDADHFLRAMADLMAGPMLDHNKALFIEIGQRKHS